MLVLVPTNMFPCSRCSEFNSWKKDLESNSILKFTCIMQLVNSSLRAILGSRWVWIRTIKLNFAVQYKLVTFIILGSSSKRTNLYKVFILKFNQGYILCY